MRLAFLGTPEAAVPSLHALVAAGHDVVLVISQPDRRRGRGAGVSASPVKAAALTLGLETSEQLSDLKNVQVERAIVVAYGAMISPELLARMPMLNVHFSLLPRWRGAAPVERAILAGDRETGVGIISLEATLDTGPLHAQRSIDIGDRRAGELTKMLAQMGADLLVEVLASPDLLNNPRPQVGESTYAAKLTTQTFHLTAQMTLTQALGVVALERAFVVVEGRRVRVREARAHSGTFAAGRVGERHGAILLGFSDGSLELCRVQPEGSREMTGASWWVGARLMHEVAWD